jgi:hypothetical protein
VSLPLRCVGRGSQQDQANASFSRWRVSPSPSGPMEDFEIGRARWQLDLVRCRGAEAHTWTVEACDASGRLAVPATWATDRLRRRNGGLPLVEVPLITAMQDGNQRVIASVDEAARRLKQEPGMTMAMHNL